MLKERKKEERKRKKFLPWVKENIVKVKKIIGVVETVAADSFSPHTFDTKIFLIDQNREPRVIFLPKALEDMYYIAGESGDVEASWLGIVKKQDRDYLVTRVIIFKQKCSSTETEIDRLDLARTVNEMMDEAEDGIGEVNDIKLWGHIHPYTTTPSGQDDKQMAIFENGNKWFIRIICNRQGRIEVTFYDYQAGVKYMDSRWFINLTENENRRAEIREELKNKITVNPEYDYSGQNAYFQYADFLMNADEGVITAGATDEEFVNQ